MSIKDSFKNISNSYISLTSIPKWMKVIILSLIPILGISIWLNSSNTQVISQKINTLGKTMNHIIDYFTLNGFENYGGIYIIFLSLIIFLYIKKSREESFIDIQEKISNMHFQIQKLEFKAEKSEKYIESEIYKQVIEGIQPLFSKIEDDTYQKIDMRIERIKRRKNEAQTLFSSYMKFIFQVNQIKRFNCEQIFSDNGLNDSEKLKKYIFLDGEYNEINHHDIPRLLSQEIERDVIPTAIKLSEFIELRQLLISYLSDLIGKQKTSYKEKSLIEDILYAYYQIPSSS